MHRAKMEGSLRLLVILGGIAGVLSLGSLTAQGQAPAPPDPYIVSVRPVDPTALTLPTAQNEARIEAFCPCIVHGIEPCTKDIRLKTEAALRPDPCPGGGAPGPGVRCGHRLASHSPTNPFQAASAFDVVGFLRDDRDPAGKAFILPTVSRWSFPYGVGKYPFTYHAGQVSGDIVLEVQFSEPEPFHSFLSRAEHPEGCDVVRDAGRVCQQWRVIAIGYWHLEEVPPPEIWDTATGRWTPYVRCGDSRNCSLTQDSAYTDPRHPTVHWADPAFREALTECLALAWLERCSEGPPVGQIFPVSLAILDISLPRGGLLDIEGTWGRPHYRHRHGTDADLDDASLAGRCAGQGWYQVLWRRPSPNEPSMGERCGLTYPILRGGIPDYNHVCLANNRNRCR